MYRNFNKYSTKNVNYNFSNYTCNISINDNYFELNYIPFKRTVCVHFKYENSEEYVVELNLGTLSGEMSVELNCKDCECISKKVSYDYGKITKLSISLRKMGIILDLLDE